MQILFTLIIQAHHFTLNYPEYKNVLVILLPDMEWLSKKNKLCKMENASRQITLLSPSITFMVLAKYNFGVIFGYSKAGMQ
jgi:hypothetical protein